MALLNNGLDKISLANEGGGEADIIATNLNKLYGGKDAYDAKSHLQKLIKFGRLHKCHYLVSMMPYLANSPLLDTDMQSLLGQTLSDEKAIWHLATQVELPIFQSDADSVKAGSFQMSRITGQQQPEIRITFLETESADILNAMQAAKKTKFLGNGLQRPPAQTAIKLRVVLFARTGHDYQPYADEFLVEVQGADVLSLAGSDGAPIEVGVTFMQVDPFMG